MRDSTDGCFAGRGSLVWVKHEYVQRASSGLGVVVDSGWRADGARMLLTVVNGEMIWVQDTQVVLVSSV